MKKIIFFVLLFFLSVSPNFSQKQGRVEKIISKSTRKIDLTNSNRTTFEYVYKNGIPYGRNCVVIYDDFYETYSISFFKENGMKTSCKIKDENFFNDWEFNYNGSKYRLSRYK